MAVFIAKPTNSTTLRDCGQVLDELAQFLIGIQYSGLKLESLHKPGLFCPASIRVLIMHACLLKLFGVI